MQAAKEANKAPIIMLKETNNPVNSGRHILTMPRSDGPVVRHPMFNWKATEKYQKLHNFEIMVKNIFTINSYITQESKRVPKILN